MDRFELIPEPLDIDIHEIPGRADEPAHLHHDIRFLLRAVPGQELSISSESLDLRWFALRDVPSMTSEASLLRMLRKAQALSD